MKNILKFNENFDITNSFEETYRKLMLLTNESYPINHLFINDVPVKFINTEDWSLLDLSEVHVEITKEDERAVYKVHNKIYDYYKLGKFPDFDVVNEYLIELNDLVNIQIVYFLEISKISIIIPLVKNIGKSIPNPAAVIDIDNYEEIHQEIFTCVSRLKSKGFKVEVKMKQSSRMELLISNGFK